MTQYLGQHFLVNSGAIEKIIKALHLARGDTVIEIGPGKGVLTIPLVRAAEKIGCRVIAIEKDRLLASALKEKTGASLPLEIIESDALKKLGELCSTLASYKIAGNIPYYLTGRLLRIIGELPHEPLSVVLMLQQEVAERVTASPPKMNLLAASVQVWADPSIIVRLTPGDFTPPPKVHSAVVFFAPRQKISSTEQKNAYYRFLKTVFRQPRKTILNNLRADARYTTEEIKKNLALFGLSGNERPQELSLQLLISLASHFEGLTVL